MDHHYSPVAETGADTPDTAMKKFQARIHQLQTEILSRNEENVQIMEENLQRNEELRELNEDLDNKVKERTRQLEASNERLASQAKQLQELGQSKDALMHMIVHDMKNPLTVVLGNLSFLKRSDAIHLESPLAGLLGDAHGQAVKLLAMIEEILAISCMQSNEFKIQPEALDLVALMRQCSTLMAQTVGPKKLTFRFEPTLPALTLQADARVLERVINNLLNNSIKYAPMGSEILLELAVEGEFAKVSVTNWGESIPQEYHERIFEMFCRVKPDDKKIKGTGIGLTFVKLAIEAHHGTIHVVSPVPPQDRGACFVCLLPLSSDANPTCNG